MKDHDVTIVSDPDQVSEKFQEFDWEKIERIMEEKGYDPNINFHRLGDKEKAQYKEDKEDAKSMSRMPKFDAVLLDMLMPATAKSLAGDSKKFVGEPTDYGMFFLWLAVQKGVPLVGILTDGSRHNHPVSATLDYLMYEETKVMTFEKSKVVIARNMTTQIAKGGDYAKDWKSLLELLQTGKKKTCEVEFCKPD